MLISRRLNPPLRVRMLAVLSEERGSREKGREVGEKAEPPEGRACSSYLACPQR